MAGPIRHTPKIWAALKQRPAFGTNAIPDTRIWNTELGNGFMIEHIGEPPTRGGTEPQPVLVGDVPSPIAPPPVPVATPEPAPLPSYTNVTPRPANWQREFGLGK
jgi:hypothetical protein